MSLKIGSGAINALYVGTQKISKAYVEEDLVFSAVKPLRLPAGYTEVEYVQVGPNNSTLYNFNLATANANQVLTLDFTIVQFGPSSSSSIGTNVSSAPSILYSFQNSNNTTYDRDALYLCSDGLFANSSAGTMLSKNKFQLISDVSVPQRVKVVWDGTKNGVSVDDSGFSIFPSYGVGTQWMLGTWTYGTNSNDTWRKACVRIHSIDIEHPYNTSASYNKNYVPAKNSSGRVGFYDLLAGKFIYHTSFVAGPAV